jgi:3-methyl-2-oxobutanoate hydroxymethyltransferase
MKVQGKDSASSAQAIIKNAKALQDAGCFSIVLECIPQEIAQKSLPAS